MSYTEALNKIRAMVAQRTVGKQVGHLVRDLRLRENGDLEEGFIYWVRFPSGSEDMRFAPVGDLE